ncbi:hypothetical protein LENED_010405 [Lentinula edodes]|uniref:Uncharacterized protein n=1 Tax=Lentinula edodes TaxID=5353 RepID=A0A1Q3EMC5_LENED|nr:hypothetical protein LENED_010405 [Lentinula edodes]
MLFDRRWAPKSSAFVALESAGISVPLRLRDVLVLHPNLQSTIISPLVTRGHLFNLLFFFLSRSDTVAIRSADSRTEGNFLGSTGTLLFIASSGWWTLGISQFSRWIQPGGQPYSAQITEWTAKLNLNALTMCLI